MAIVDVTTPAALADVAASQFPPDWVTATSETAAVAPDMVTCMVAGAPLLDKVCVMLGGVTLRVWALPDEALKIKRAVIAVRRVIAA